MTPSAFNANLSTPRSPTLTAVAVFVLASAAFLTRAGVQVGFNALPGPGDEAEYDLLAMELAAGNGFRFDYDNATWRAPYEQANDDGTYDVLLNRHGAAATTYRPPLFPTVTAGLYSLFGRSFAAVRVFNCLIMAAAGAVAAWLVAKRLGVVPGLLCGVLFAVVEHRARYHAGLVLTESLASLLAVLLAVALVRLGETNRLRTVAIAGVVAGLGILNRPLAALWMPVLVLLVWWIASQRRFSNAAIFAVVTLIVIAPWAVRNSLLLGRFSPFGTHGQQNLAAAYSDEAVERRGLWFRLDGERFFPAAIDDSRPGLDRELARATLSTRQAVDWVRANPLKVPLLAAMRTWQLWQPRMHWDALVLGLAALGLVLWPVTTDRRVLCGLLLANTLAVAATWSVGGRFLVPLLPMLHAAAACGLWAMILVATERRSDVRGWLRRSDGER
ncbi:MAG: glycosyltransferase family 39 protein [Planctomycetaceae bacterium]